jgi:hypothetical protein
MRFRPSRACAQVDDQRIDLGNEELAKANARIAELDEALKHANPMLGLLRTAGEKNLTYEELAKLLFDSFGDSSVHALHAACAGMTVTGCIKKDGGNNFVRILTLPSGDLTFRASNVCMSREKAARLRDKLKELYRLLKYDVLTAAVQTLSTGADNTVVVVVAPHFGVDVHTMIKNAEQTMQAKLLGLVRAFFSVFTDILLTDIKVKNMFCERNGLGYTLRIGDLDEATLFSCTLAEQQGFFALLMSYLSGLPITPVHDSMMETLREHFRAAGRIPGTWSDISPEDGALVYRLSREGSTLVGAVSSALEAAVANRPVRLYFKDFWYFLLKYLLDTVENQEKYGVTMPVEFKDLRKYIEDRDIISEIKSLFADEGESCTLFLPFATKQRSDFARAYLRLLFHLAFALRVSAQAAREEYTKLTSIGKITWRSSDEWSNEALRHQSGISLSLLNQALMDFMTVLSSGVYRKECNDSTSRKLYPTRLQ